MAKLFHSFWMTCCFELSLPLLHLLFTCILGILFHLSDDLGVFIYEIRVRMFFFDYTEELWELNRRGKKKDKYKYGQGSEEIGTLFTLLLGMYYSRAAVETVQQVPPKVKRAVATWLSNSAPIYTPKRNENVSTQKLVHGCLQRHHSE